MNPKITKLADEIEKMKTKIIESQSKLKEMEQQKLDLENADIISLVRNADLPPDEFERYISTIKAQKNRIVPDVPMQKEENALEN